MSTAAERAAEVLRDHASWDVEVKFLGTEDRMCRPVTAVAALMADPDLLRELAIEAGGLTPDLVFETFIADDGQRSMRRASRPTGEDRP